jgi:hypothetical protein
VARILLTFILATLPCAAQFRTMKIWFSGTGCASCTESLSERMKRVRGVESAQVNAQEGTLDLRLAPQNRVRLEQIRDFIEQDGTKATRAVVRVNGEVEKLGDRWFLRPPGVSTTYEIAGPDLKPGPAIVAGEVREFRAGSGTIQIRATRVEAQAP